MQHMTRSVRERGDRTDARSMSPLRQDCGAAMEEQSRIREQGNTSAWYACTGAGCDGQSLTKNT